MVVTNYLWRPLWPQVLASVRPGGVLLYETFAHGNAAYGKPSRPDFLLARIFHRSRATNEYGIALVCPKIQVSNLDQRAGNAEAKLYRRN